MSLAETEEVEDEVKTLLRAIFREVVNGDDARFLAQWQHDLGFLLKYKSYGVKCATPLGYSVFLLNPGEGFSFQRHLTRKTEIFLILEPLERALVFLCTSPEWEAAYSTDLFQQWLDGARNKQLDCLAIRPLPGDVYHVHDLGLVHSVLGCILEEFATVSTDMVDRLHDQNAGRAEPHIPREQVMARLHRLTAHRPRIDPTEPESAGVIVLEGTAETYRLPADTFEGTRVHASRGRVVLPPDSRRARVLFMVEGSASCTLQGRGDAEGATHPPIGVRGGELLMIAPGAVTTIEIADAAAFSIQAIEPEVALA
jgi:hypothetical protein